MKHTKFISFYSHKGGVGRSMTLSNIAYLLSKDGFKVCIIDFDLEAPGQHKSDLFIQNKIKKGLLDLIFNYQKYYSDENEQFFNWEFSEYSIKSNIFDKINNNSKNGDLYLIPAGNLNNELYAQELAQLDWTNFYQEGGNLFFNSLQAKLNIENFDYVLIDSRTGFSDVFYISTLTLADTTVLISAMNRQNIEGIKKAYDVLTSQKAEKNYGKKNLILVNSPFPDLDQATLARRDSEINEEWKEFESWHVRIPYKPHLALSENVLAYEQDIYKSPDDSYLTSIKLLKSIITGEVEINSSIKDTKPSNPYSIIRTDHLSEKEWVKYYVDPGDIVKTSMESFMPTLIYGARGSGKTMLGKMLSYQAEIERNNGNHSKHSFNFIGLYFKIEIDILGTFNTYDEKDYNNKLFGQYLDLIFFREAINALNEIDSFSNWFPKNISKFLKNIFREMNIESINEEDVFEQLIEEIENQIYKIRAYLNNPNDVKKPFNIQPNILMKILTETLTQNGLFNDCFFIIIIDEYENFRDYQQIIVNTKLKQVKESHKVTYKLLMRDDGLRTSETLAKGQPIQDLHDYRSYNLIEMFERNKFSLHAKKIANKYIELNPYFRNKGYSDIEDILETIDYIDEANTIGGTENALEKWLLKNHPKEKIDKLILWFKEEENILKKTIAVNLLNQGKEQNIIIKEFKNNTQKAKDWYNNYKVGSLFWLYSIKGLKKRYAGFNTLVNLSGNNIRTMLEFCYSIIEEWISREEYHLPINIKLQNDVIHRCSKEYKKLLQSEDEYCPEVFNMVERIGRLFESLQKSPKQSEVEINHFSIKNDMSKNVEKYIRICYRTTALRRIEANKQKQLSDLRHDAWQLHPRFAPAFGISPRKKKQIYLTNSELETILFGTKESWSTFLKEYSKKHSIEKEQSLIEKEQSLFD